jgi:hypothetical protein
MGKWEADQTATVEGKDCQSYYTALLWIVPAKVEGTWKLSEGELKLKQNFQMVSGSLHSGANTVPVTNGKLSGDLINLNAGNVKYTGRVSGSTMEGIYESGGITTKWKATQVGKVL